MKKSLSLVLAVLMVTALLVPVLSMTVAAAGSTVGLTGSTYLVYEENFDSVSADAKGMDLLEQLGWYVPSAKAHVTGAVYSIAQKPGKDINGNDIVNNALRVDALNAAEEAFINVFAGDVMSVLRNSDFVLKYRLTYREETTNSDGYAALVYNYNEMHGSVANGEGNEAYGITAVRMCGTGFNAVYYPAAGANCDFHSLEKDPGSPYTMSSRYDAISGQPSLYARLVHGAQEGKNDIRKGTSVMANHVMEMEIHYDREDGVFVFINGIRVSDMNYDLQYNASIRNEDLWEDFVTRNAGATIALLVQPGVVADIDDIKIETSNIQAVSGDVDMPALLITEVCGFPTLNWGEFIEIYNPTNEEVDVANYSLAYSSVVTAGTAVDDISGSRKTKYTSYIKLGDYFGKAIKNAYPQFFTTAQLAEEPSWDYATEWYFSDEEIAAISAMGYYVKKASTTKYQRASSKPSGSNNYSYTTYSSGTVYYLCNVAMDVPFKQLENGDYFPAADGIYRLAHYVENWNTRYTVGSTDYESNSKLKPGECMILYMCSTTYMNQWKQGMINNGNLSSEIQYRAVGTKNYSFRHNYKNYGLTKDTKILAITTIGVSDAASSTFAIGKSTDEAGNDVVYTSRYLTDMSYIESKVNYVPTIATGKQLESDTMQDSANIGHGGEVQADMSATYVYGVDASSDYRCGTLYTSLTPINSSSKAHVGKIAEYQRIIFDGFYKRANSLPDMMITEIIPRTNNLAGESLSAFAAMELTNTSGKELNAYNYSLVRNVAGLSGATAGSGFKYSTALKPGNPVVKGDGNGAYFYFAEDSISNPETCILQPGESLVVWFLTEDTYSSYYADDEFGEEYFRQYWINNGCPELGLKSTDGEYLVKVIAVDGCDSEIYNAPNYSRVFKPAYGTYDYKDRYQNDTSAIYGVANISGEFTSGAVPLESVISIAYLGVASVYYELNKTELAAADGSDTLYYANVLKCCQLPVNTGMRYVAGLTYSNRISAMKASLKVQYYYYSGNKVWTTTNANQANMMYNMRTSSAQQLPGLGTLEGEEAYCIKDSLFLATKEGDTTVYRYFAENRNAITTIAGAAVSLTPGATKLRFDSMVRLDTFTSLVATYGANFNYGTLIVKTDDLLETTALNYSSLMAIGAKDVKSELLYYTDDFAVLGTSIEVAEADYGTEYTAVAYMTVTTKDGQTHVYYSVDSTSRSVAYVANAALKDLKNEKTDVYSEQVSENKYSRFTAEQRQLLQSYIK